MKKIINKVLAILKGVAIFFVAIIIFAIIASIVFPESDAGGTDIQASYTFVMLIVSISASFLLRGKKFKTKNKNLKQKETENNEHVFCQESAILADEPKVEKQIEVDILEHQAALIIFETKQASISMLQRRLKLCYAATARIIDYFEECGIVGTFSGSTPRQVLITKEQYLKHAKFVDRSNRDPQQGKKSFVDTSKNKSVDLEQIIKNENDWRREQQGISPIEYELQQVDGMDGHCFEHWCAKLLRENGFTKVEVTRGSNDQGVDIIAVKDGIHYAIQCKCYSSDLGNAPIQEVHTGKEIYHCQIGAVMSNRHFTSGAKQAAEATGTLLWDRDKLITMLENSQKEDAINELS